MADHMAFKHAASKVCASAFIIQAQVFEARGRRSQRNSTILGAGLSKSHLR